MIDTPGDFQAGGQSSAHEVRRLNELLRMAEAGSSFFSGDENGESFNGPHGQSASTDSSRPYPESFWALIVNKGPKGEVDYTNSRYWVQKIYLDQSDHTSKSIQYTASPKADTTLDGGRWIVATNVDEIKSESHYLHVTDPEFETKPENNVTAKDPTLAVFVKVYCVPGMCQSGKSNDKPYCQYIFSKTIVTVIVTGRIISNATGKGKYNGRSFRPRANSLGDVSATTDLADSDLGTLASVDDCLVLNVVENGLSTSGHMVTEAVNTGQFAIYFVGVLQQINTDGKKVVRAQLYYAGC